MPGRFREDKKLTKYRWCKPGRLLVDPNVRRKSVMFHSKFEQYIKLKQKQKVRSRKPSACGRGKISYALDTCDSFIHKNLASLGSWWLNERTVFKPWNKYPLGSLCWIAPYLCKELSWVKWLWWAFPEAQCFCSSQMEGCCARKGRRDLSVNCSKVHLQWGKESQPPNIWCTEVHCTETSHRKCTLDSIHSEHSIMNKLGVAEPAWDVHGCRTNHWHRWIASVYRWDVTGHSHWGWRSEGSTYDSQV